jgi:hypothetical protein
MNYSEKQRKNSRVEEPSYVNYYPFKHVCKIGLKGGCKEEENCNIDWAGMHISEYAQMFS